MEIALDVVTKCFRGWLNSVRGMVLEYVSVGLCERLDWIELNSKQSIGKFKKFC